MKLKAVFMQISNHLGRASGTSSLDNFEKKIGEIAYNLASNKVPNPFIIALFAKTLTFTELPLPQGRDVLLWENEKTYQYELENLMRSYDLDQSKIDLFNSSAQELLLMIISQITLEGSTPKECAKSLNHIILELASNADKVLITHQ